MSEPQAFFFYISGHGFGHASRQIEIINAVGRASPGTRIVIRTSAPAWLFERAVEVPFTLIPGETDTGVVQIDSLRMDEQATVARAAAFHRTMDARAGAEAARLRAQGARLVVADAPPLACAAAAEAAIPSVIVSNFTWDWIYAQYEPADVVAELIGGLQRAYGRAECACRLPMHGGFESIRSVVDVPFVARHARHEREDVRGRLGLPLDVRLALTSFGGYGVAESYLARLDCLDECEVVVTRRGSEAQADVGSGLRGVHVVPEERLYGEGLRYEDLVRGVDVVVTKPGYGIIAECIANGTAILYTSRGRFAEYDVLAREMPRFVRCEYIDHDSLFAGRWRDRITTLLSSPPAPERPATSGAEMVAGLILERIHHERC